ncbi:MAG: phosphate transport system regulatory protein PhoU [Bacteroidetes bacterium HGW-Bacteroidetes-20]|nr:MAG: phosphate transport system regulatory protein PhoU [Bacteroidetes bacterium HGW-Bacteroidetes-20]
MKHSEQELLILKDEVIEMWKFVISQLEKSKKALLFDDIELAREIISREKRVDLYELKIESDCENHIALYCPVAIDLRLVLSLIKITSSLERIGDFTEGIARHVVQENCSILTPQLVEDLKLENMFDLVIGMLTDTYALFNSAKTEVYGKILCKDDDVDEIYKKSFNTITQHLINNPLMIRNGLELILLVRKLERIGDYCSNLVEDVVFYVDAKVLKHSNGSKLENDAE